MRTIVPLIAFVAGLWPVLSVAPPHLQGRVAQQQAENQSVVLIVEGMT